MSDQTTANVIMIIMTAWNLIMATAMIAGFPVLWGMPIAFCGMGILVVISWHLLMDSVKPWE
jgi:hypothetical protein